MIPIPPPSFIAPPLTQPGQGQHLHPHSHINPHSQSFPPAVEGYRLHESPEVFDDELSNKSGGTSWTKRIPWMRRKPNTSPSHDLEVRSALSADSYLSKQSVSFMTSPLPTSVSNDPKQNRLPGGPGFIARTLSRMSRSSWSPHHKQPQVGEFHESDWTPPDSAYGAACPVCGCLPKKVRRAIEMTLIGAVVLVLIYLVVTTSIRIGNDHGKGKTSSSQDDDARIKLDDDYYIEYNKKTNDDAASTNDDAAATATGDDTAAAGATDEASSNNGNRDRVLRLAAAPPWSLMDLLLPQDLI